VTPQQTITAIAVAALQNDAAGLTVLLTDLPDDHVRTAAGVALINLCSGFRQIVTPADWQDIVTGMQALAAHTAQEN
jgi:hypothetical protein